MGDSVPSPLTISDCVRQLRGVMTIATDVQMHIVDAENNLKLGHARIVCSRIDQARRRIEALDEALGNVRKNVRDLALGG